MNRALIEERCRELGLDPHTVARHASVDPFFLVDTDGRRAEDGLPLGVLRFLSRFLDIGLDELVDAPRRPTEQPGDDVRLEAAFAMVGKLCRDDIAQVFNWTLDRVERALAALETRLRPTGHRLHHIGWHRYSIEAARSVLTAQERARLEGRTPCHKFLRAEDAEVLRLVIAGRTDKRIWDRPGVRLSVERLVIQGLLVDHGAELAVSPALRFSLRLDEEEA